MKNKYKIILIAIFIIAIVIRTVFICKTNISELQFDFGIGELSSEEQYNNLYENFDEEPNKGRHINYIMQLYTYNSLPNKIIGQFYHPPLHHFIMSTWLKIAYNIFDTSSARFESMQFITLIYSVIILAALYKLLGELEIEDKNKILPMLLFAFYPLYIFLSGSLNNDELVTMFSLLALLYLVKWEKNPTMKNAVIIALCIGLGLMTKTSIAVIIIPTVYVYFKKLGEFVKEDKSVKKLLIQLLVFSIISISLGLWFQFRSLANGLYTLGIIEPYEYLSIADKSLWERFGISDILNISDVNIWSYLIYSSLNFFAITSQNGIFNLIMAILVIALAVDTIYFMIKNKFKNKILLITFISWWISYFYLNLNMPYMCSMHSRYMVVPISVGIAYLGLGMKEEKNKVIKIQTYISVILLSIMSIINFILI